MDIARPFIRLPYAFDADRMAAEVAGLPASAWMAHPTRMIGNSAVALISRNGDDNDEFAGRMSPTPHLAGCEYLQQVMASFGEVLGRSRVMKLAARSEVSTHVDFNYHWYTRVRIHIPVITNPQVTFYCADQALHMQAGECWIFNSWRRHRVTNDSDEDRVHLVLDTAGSSQFWAQVRDMEQLDPRADRETLEQRMVEVPYRPGAAVDIPVERYNIAPVMAPGEVDALVRDLIAEFQGHSANDPALVERYIDLLLGFARDWRQAWLLYGYEADGLEYYRGLIERLQGALHPDRRALLTGSNEIGVNPIIVQRILRAALAPDQLAYFRGDS